MKFNSILETIGNTPHVKINRLYGPDANIFIQLERANPGGSIKDKRQHRYRACDGCSSQGLQAHPGDAGINVY